MHVTLIIRVIIKNTSSRARACSRMLYLLAACVSIIGDDVENVDTQDDNKCVDQNHTSKYKKTTLDYFN